MGEEKKRAGLGFEDELDNLDIKDWNAGKGSHKRAPIDPQAVREVARQQGFTSREPVSEPLEAPKPKKELTDQINIRAKLSVIEAFKALSAAQEPKWPLGYTLERALAALRRELEGKS